MKNIKIQLSALIGAIVILGSTNVFAYLPLNKEVKCTINEMSYYVDRKQTSKTNPTDTKPTYYLYDGKILKAYYKHAPQSIPAANGAKFVSQKTSQDSGETTICTFFEKTGTDSLVNKLMFCKKMNTNYGIALMDSYSQNNFSSYGRNISQCD
jgi:hypothetical protein